MRSEFYLHNLVSTENINAKMCTFSVLCQKKALNFHLWSLLTVHACFLTTNSFKTVKAEILLYMEAADFGSIWL